MLTKHLRVIRNACRFRFAQSIGKRRSHLNAALGHRMKRVFTSFFLVIFLAGCIPPSAMLKSQNIQSVEAGFVADSETGRLLASNEAVDLFAIKIQEVLEEHGFSLSNKSTSFGLLPATGHTQNMDLSLAGNVYTSAHAEISKSKIRVVFREMEREHGSNVFVTTAEEINSIKAASEAVDKYIKTKIGQRSVRVTFYDNPEKP